MANDARVIRAPGSRLVWNREAPVVSLVAIPGTPCRCTVSRRALESLAGVRRLGPWACLDIVDRCRALIEAIAARKYLLEGAGPDRVIHVTSADVVAAGVAAPATAIPAGRAAEADPLAAPPADVAAGIAA
jgi:hypothetical protein